MSRQRNIEALKAGTEVIEIISGEFDVQRLSQYHYRVEDRIDLFPVNNRYHDILKDVRGQYPKRAHELVGFLNNKMKLSVKLMFKP